MLFLYKHTERDGKSMKKILLSALIILTLSVAVSCQKSQTEFPEGFFDTKPNLQQEEQDNKGTPSGTDTGKTPQQNSGNKSEDKTVPTEKDDKSKTDTVKKDTEDKKDVEKDNTSEEKDGKTDADSTHYISVVEFSHSEKEKNEILSRYSEAEDFYYDILNQNFELDNMDVVTAVSDGYSTDYHRVILEDVNSLSELRSLYGRYFTADFIVSLDLSAYKEADGKLYCAATSASAGKNKGYTAKVESTSEDKAIVVRKDTQSGGVQRINAVKQGDAWYFGGVAMR